MNVTLPSIPEVIFGTALIIALFIGGYYILRLVIGAVLLVVGLCFLGVAMLIAWISDLWMECKRRRRWRVKRRLRNTP